MTRTAQEQITEMASQRDAISQIGVDIRAAGHRAVASMNVALQRGHLNDAERRGGRYADRARQRLLAAERRRDEHARRASVAV